MKKLIGLFLVLFVSIQLNAQLRGGYGTYMLNQSAFNPGFQDINTRFGGNLNFRRQWMSYADAPITATANGYYRFTRNHGVGLVTSYDKIDEVGTFDVGANYTYQAWMTDLVAVGLGIKFGFSQRTIGSNFVYFDAGDPTFNQMSTAGFNMGAGLSIQSQNFDFGVSLPFLFDNQLGKKNQIYATTDNHLYAHVGYKLRTRNDWFVFYPTVLVKGVPGSNLNMSFDGHFLFGQWLWMGGGYRSDNGVGASVGVFLDDGLRIVYNYESSLFSPHKRFNNTHEVTLNYARSIKDNPFKRRRYTVRKGGKLRKSPRMKG
jgi:type IX secretion system PorP/SprF family membrane protein